MVSSYVNQSSNPNTTPAIINNYGPNQPVAYGPNQPIAYGPNQPVAYGPNQPVAYGYTKPNIESYSSYYNQSYKYNNASYQGNLNLSPISVQP